MFRSLLLGLAVLFSPSLTYAGDWILVDPPTYLHQNCNTCVNTFSKGGYHWYVLDVPCVIRKGVYGGSHLLYQGGHIIHQSVQQGANTVINSGDLLLHSVAPPFCHHRCNHWSHSTYRIYQRPRWSRYSIFSMRRLCR